MSGQMTEFKEKAKLVDDFIARVNPYEKQPSLKFDLRGYATFLRENGLSGKDVPLNIVEKFQK